MANVLKNLYVFFCFFPMVFIAGCGEHSEDYVGSGDTGTAIFRLAWIDEYSGKAPGAPVVDCESEGIFTITVEVYKDSSDEYLADESFPCSDGEGTVDNLPVEQDLMIVVMGNDSFGDPIYKGVKEGVTIFGEGTPTDVGYIEMRRLGSLLPVVSIDQSSSIFLGYDESSTLITGTITAENGLKEVSIRITEGSTLIFNKTYEEPFDSEPIAYDDAKQYAIHLNLDDIDADTTVVFSAADRFDQWCDPVEVEIRRSEGVELNRFELVMGAQGDNLHGGAASLTSGNVYFIALSKQDDVDGARRNASDVDIIYYHGVNWLESLYSPDAEAIHSDTTGLDCIKDEEWGYYRATRLDYADISSRDFDEIVYAHQLPDVSGLRSDHASSLQEGDVLVFKTESGDRGVIKVNHLVDGEGGSIELDVKVTESF